MVTVTILVHCVQGMDGANGDGSPGIAGKRVKFFFLIVMIKSLIFGKQEIAIRDSLFPISVFLEDPKKNFEGVDFLWYLIGNRDSETIKIEERMCMSPGE